MSHNENFINRPVEVLKILSLASATLITAISTQIFRENTMILPVLH